MSSPTCEKAIGDALKYGRAILKFISPNDVGKTGGHQCGYYLPKKIWQVYTPNPPEKGINSEHDVEVIWQDGRSTESKVKWYGRGTRSEYRLTRFGRDFPFLNDDCIGNLLVLIPERLDRFYAYVLDHDDDIEDILAALGVEIIERWALYDREAPLSEETEDECLDRRFRRFTETLTDFPPTSYLADEARNSLIECVKGFMGRPCDDQLMNCLDVEYHLFKMVERSICEPEIVRLFKSVDDFLKTAQSILQRRKARAGLSLEHHVEYLLKQAKIPFDMRIDVDGTKPDVLIPGRKEYLDKSFPDRKLFMLGIKRTCKDRWRQVTREAPRIIHKHILTTQEGVSSNQLKEMKSLNITLVVPVKLHTGYPKEYRPELYTLAQFIDFVRKSLAPN